MKRIKQILIVLAALAGTAGAWAAVTQFGGTETKEWTATSADGCNSGTTITLDGAVVTLGSADNSSVTWDWNAKNGGLLPSQMPTTDGTTGTLITSFSATSPFGTLPTKGCFLQIQPTKKGTITIKGKPSANAAQKLVFVTLDKSNPSTILAAQITDYNAATTEWSYAVDADHLYYFFQMAYPNQLTGYRFTLRGLAFDDNVTETETTTVWTIGDSTMANKTSATERGWGMLFPTFVDATQVTVSNHATDGRSTKSFIDEGRWETVRSQLAEGDYVLMEFGHNDEKTTSSLHTDPQTTYKENLTKFINETRAAGATPVLLTPIVRRIFGPDGNIYDEHGEYCTAVRELAAALNVPLIDMNILSGYYENVAGIVGSRDIHEYFPGKEIDNTHMCQLGAYITARCVAEQIALNDDIDIPLNANPAAQNGAYSSTLAFAQHYYQTAYPGRAVPTTLAALDASVRALRREARQALVTADKPADATFALVNPDFVEGTCWYNGPQASYPMGWNLSKSTSGTENIQVKTDETDGFNYFIVWAPTMNYIDMSQTVADLPDGTYQVTAQVNASAGAEGSTTYLYATSGDATQKTTVTALDAWTPVSVQCEVTDGELRLGLRSEGGAYHRIADVHLTLVSVPEGSGTEALEVSAEATEGAFVIANTTGVTPIIYNEGDHSVVGVAANAIASDIKAITGQEPTVLSGLPAEVPSSAIILGTIGQSGLIDQLVTDEKIDVSAINGKWEAYTLQVVSNPMSGVSQALVIAGSTPRGTAYGAFELSRLMGVSPWIWWADVPPEPRTALYATAGSLTVDEPSVKFRGIFINDEDWGLQPWAAKKMDTDIKNIGPRTYERVMELLLRLRANILWPAMHKCSTAFWNIAENPQLAAKYDIVLGSSHCEPMLRNNVGEWTGGDSNYNYATNASGVQAYWRQRVEESKDMDVMYTLGMRGVHDGSIQGYSGAANIAAGLKDIIAFQRGLIEEIVNPDVTQVPQTFIPYKEVLDAYNAGLQVPDDVTLTWVDDNHGYIRQMPTESEQARSGSNGIYYNLSYYGSPQDYLWLSTIGPSQISYELTRGYQQGIQRLWIINVGDIKPAEAELEFCMDLAWDVNAWGPTKAAKWSRTWAARTFGEDVADELGAIKQEYYRLAAGGKPEHVAFVDYSTEEMNQRIADYEALAARVDAVKGSIRSELQDAFFELIEYPVRGAYLMNVKHLRATQSFTEANAGRGTTALQYASAATAAYDEIQTLTTKYNKQIAGGKWDGIMSAAPRSQAAFNKPSVATEADVVPVESNFSEGTHLTVAAADYTSASSSVKKLDGLGMQEQAVCVWPMDLTSYSQATDAPYVDYSLPVKAGTNIITLRFLPTFPLHAGGTLRYGIQFLTAGGKATTFSIATTATSSTWNQNVLRGWSTGKSHEYEADEDGTLAIRVYLMDPGIALSEITIDQEAENESLTDSYIVNPDFELSAEGVTNSGGATVRGVPYGWSTNIEFTGNSKGINGTGTNMHGANSCWFWNKPMPADFEFYQTIKDLEPGRYRISCRLGARSGYMGTMRLFAGADVQYFGKESDYNSSIFVKGERNTFAGHSGTSDYNTLQSMFVDFQITEKRDINVGIRTSNVKADGTTDTSGETGTFRVDYFQLFRLGDAVPTYTVTFRLGTDEESYAGFVPLFNADFAATEGVTAYVATAEHDGVVTLCEVSAVPAGTPVILKGTKGQTVTIAEATSAPAAVETNLLRAAHDTEIAATDPRYVLTYQTEQWLFAHYAGILPEGKVYLELPTGEVKSQLHFVFDKETGISRPATDSSKSTTIYNLGGTQLSSPQGSGVYVVNGKKVAIKQ
ncbi:MAG: glycosyl hydrolase 115 family protein [Bacteroidaceae bacterium]|nr:glycosyl hydrolase 115 family protein [Bacteroidaceae bacterium]